MLGICALFPGANVENHEVSDVFAIRGSPVLITPNP